MGVYLTACTTSSTKSLAGATKAPIDCCPLSVYYFTLLSARSVIIERHKSRSASESLGTLHLFRLRFLLHFLQETAILSYVHAHFTLLCWNIYCNSPFLSKSAHPRVLSSFLLEQLAGSFHPANRGKRMFSTKDAVMW
jgi:hypothetical protein